MTTSPPFDHQALVNRLRRMARHHGRWARRQGFDAYRIYDRDLPDVPAVLDNYGPHLVLWLMPRKRDETSAQARAFADAVLAAITACWPDQRCFVKQRQRQRHNKQRQQYVRLDQQQETCIVTECGHQFEINVSDYLDVGLFLDHRHTRQQVAEQAAGCRVLNCFAYTGSFSVYALAGGASSCLSLDLSATYLEWAQRNLQRNGLAGEQAPCQQVDVLAWLEQGHQPEHFDMIICDPPTFSNSKRMQRDWQVSRDHPWLLWRLWNCLKPGGTLWFSTNQRGFQLAASGLPPFTSRELTPHSIPHDFRNRRIHRCWQLTRPTRTAG